MKTLLQILRIALWTMPMQRVLLLLGLVLGIGSWASGEGLVMAGMMLAMLLPVLCSGMFLRKLSAPRHALLWPRGRGRLLFGTIGTMVIVTLVFAAGYGLDFVRFPPQYRPRADSYGMMYTLLFVFWTQCTLSMFVASRSPAWALLIVGAWFLPGIVMRMFGLDGVPRQLTGPAGLFTALFLWVAFAIWFLSVRRIGDAGWRMRGGAVALNPQVDQTPATRELAMQRWLLNSATPLSISLQWALCATVLVAVQLAIPRLLGGHSPRRTVTATLFGTLSLTAAAIGAVSWNIAKRSRGLWLTAGRSRLELFGWCERLMVKVIVVTAVPLAALACVLWLFLESRPTMPPTYLVLSLIAPVLGAGWFGLMQVDRRIALDGVAMAMVLAGWYFGLIVPLYREQLDPNWTIVMAELAFVVLLREIAYARWRAADWPSMQPKPSFD